MKALRYLILSYRNVLTACVGAVVAATAIASYVCTALRPGDLPDILLLTRVSDELSEISRKIVIEIEESRGPKFPQAWKSSVWWSDAFPTVMGKAIRRLCFEGRNLTIALVGGSSSAPQQNWLYHLGWKLQTFLDMPFCAGDKSKPVGRLILLNPSQGDTTSIWGALYLNTLIPKDTDLILWEYTINDSVPGDSNEFPSDFQKKVFEIFIRRALARNPSIMVGMLSTWQQNASSCWPCEFRCQSYNDIVWVARGYPSISTFAMDLETMLTHMSWPKKEVFRDHHHPADLVYELVGDALLELFLVQLLDSRSVGRWLPSVSPPVSQRLRQQGGGDTGSGTLMFPPLPEKHPLLSHILDISRQSSSFTAFEPFFGQSVEPQNAITETPVGKALANRTDRKYTGHIPLCNESSPFIFRPTSQSGNSLRFVGLSLFPKNRDDWFSEVWEVVVQVYADAFPMNAIPREELRHGGAGVLVHGAVSPFDPQGWFALPANITLQHASEISICQHLPKFGLTGAVFV